MGEDNNMIDILITESKAGDLHNIEVSSAHIYTHLMKFISIRPISTSWIGTIKNQNKELIKIKNTSYWREVANDPVRLEKIKRKAISDFENDGNKNGEILFNVVHNDLYDITKFKDINILKNYMISHLDPIEDQDMINYVNHQLK